MGVPLCKQRHYYEKTWPKVVPAKKTQMLSTHLSTCPKFAGLSSAERLKTVNDQGACLTCSGWDHTKHKAPGGAFTGEPKCKVKTGGVECGGKHGVWFHPISSGAATTGTVHEACDRHRPSHQLHHPGLYKVYSIAVPKEEGGAEVATVLIDPGSDTNYVCHDFTRKLGLTGMPYACFLKVVNMDYVQNKTSTYELRIVDREGMGTSSSSSGTRYNHHSPR